MEVAMSRAMRVGVAAGALLVAVVAFLVVRPSDEDDQSEPSRSPETAGQRSPAAEGGGESGKSPAIAVLRPGSVREIEVHNGDRVRFAVRSPRTEEAHVHGYDLLKEVPAGGTARFDFRASLEGVFEIELEQSEEQVGELRVLP